MKRLISKNIYIKNSKASKQSGFSLIEVMIAALILSIGILGVAGLQIIGMKGTQQSHMKQQAVAIIHSLTERMTSNKPGVIAGNYENDSESFDCSNLPTCNSGVTCSPADIATVDLNNIFCGYKVTGSPNTAGVKYQVAGDVVSLAEGELDISCVTDCTDGELRLEIEWQEQAFDSREDQSPPKDIIVLNTRIAP